MAAVATLVVPIAEAAVDQTRSLAFAAFNVGASRKWSITEGQSESQQSTPLGATAP